jgi:hypothetical protein
VKKDSLLAAPKVNTAKATNVKPYDKVITAKAVTRCGMCTVRKMEGNYYLELSDSLLGWEILLVNRIGRSSAKGIEANKRPYYVEDGSDERMISFGHAQLLSKVSTPNIV